MRKEKQNKRKDIHIKQHLCESDGKSSTKLKLHIFSFSFSDKLFLFRTYSCGTNLLLFILLNSIFFFLFVGCFMSWMYQIIIQLISMRYLHPNLLYEIIYINMPQIIKYNIFIITNSLLALQQSLIPELLFIITIFIF